MVSGCRGLAEDLVHRTSKLVGVIDATPPRIPTPHAVGSSLPVAFFDRAIAVPNEPQKTIDPLAS